MEEKDEIRFSALEDKAELINSNIELILGAIRGNPLTMDGGIVKDISNLSERVAENHATISRRMQLLEDRVKPIEQFVARINWTIVIICFIGTCLGGAIGLLIQYLSSKK